MMRDRTRARVTSPTNVVVATHAASPVRSVSAEVIVSSAPCATHHATVVAVRRRRVAEKHCGSQKVSSHMQYRDRHKHTNRTHE